MFNTDRQEDNDMSCDTCTARVKYLESVVSEIGHELAIIMLTAQNDEKRLIAAKDASFFALEECFKPEAVANGQAAKMLAKSQKVMSSALEEVDKSRKVLASRKLLLREFTMQLDNARDEFNFCHHTEPTTTICIPFPAGEFGDLPTVAAPSK